jgi:mannose-6-phosphate isomerase-like protein (cupin superfamily)
VCFPVSIGILFRGYLPIMSGWAMAQFLNGLDVKGSSLKGFLLESSERVSLGFAFGARYVDRSYIRRKFRAVLALDRLIDEIRSCGGDYRKLPPQLMGVAGDNAEMPFDRAGYREASRAELSVYLVPLAILVVVIVLVVRWRPEDMISKFRLETEFYTDERCYIVEMHNREEDKGCSIVRARVAPGVTTQFHSLRGIDERYVILEGEGLVEVGDAAPAPVRPLDVVAITAGTSQRITSVGTTDLIFVCVCTPRFREETYVSAESDCK